MLSDFLKDHITSQAGYVEYGYGQVEPNHLSAQRTAQIYAQLPAAASINVLEQGQFVKYDYAAGVCDFTGAGEWMLVFNEIKLYRENQMDCEFAMLKDNYQARLYSPFGGQPGADTNFDAQSRYYNGKDSTGATSTKLTFTADKVTENDNGSISVGNAIYTADEFTKTGSGDSATYEVTFAYDDVTAAPDMYELHYNEDPYHIESNYKPAKMPVGTTMVPRVFKTNVGDIFTTNTVKDTTLAVGDILTPGTINGILEKVESPAAGTMQWQVVKVYTLADHQKAVKVMRIA